MRGKRRVLTMPDELWDRLKAEADRKGVSAAELARRYMEYGLQINAFSYQESARAVGVELARQSRVRGEGLIVE
jgi:hypothetical protein